MGCNERKWQAGAQARRCHWVCVVIHSYKVPAEQRTSLHCAMQSHRPAVAPRGSNRGYGATRTTMASACPTSLMVKKKTDLML